MLQPRWRPHRVAWLLTHSSLRSAEVPVLQSLGCEVWTQKAFPSYLRSASASPRWDQGSTLPPEALAQLNAFDFYSNEITPDIAALLNEHFQLAIVDAFPIKTREVLRAFHGPVVIRAFGREHPYSYYDSYFVDYYPDLRKITRENYARLWFSACYPEITAYENDAFRRRAVFLPLALPESALAREGTWQGGDPRILFVCPSINDHPYYRQVYDDFKQHFGDLPHVITGHQFKPVDDPLVLGFLPADQYAHLHQHAQVMYYHSREPRHLHYHPVEAMASGMPVVYLRGGLLEGYDTGSQAGACHDESEARQKLQAILAGDHALTDAIRESQRTVVDQWRPEVPREAWRNWFNLFAPDAAGKIPAHELWQATPPPGLLDEPPEEPGLALRLWFGATKYLGAAWQQGTPLPTGIRRLERLRQWVTSWSSSAPQDKAA